MSEEQCAASKKSPTAEGDVEVRCAKAPGHDERGDPQHEGWIKVFPVRWVDDAPGAASATAG